MQVESPVYHGKPMRSQVILPKPKVTFGQAPGYAKDILVKTTELPVDTVSLTQPAKQATVFIRPQNQVSGLFKREDPFVASLAKSFEALLKGSPAQVHQDDARNIYSLISGKPDNNAIAQAFRKALAKLPGNTTDLQVSLPQVDKGVDAVARDLAEQAILQGYNVRYYRQKPTPPGLNQVVLNNLPTSPQVEAAIREGQAIGRGMNLTRFLVDGPPNVKNPLWISNYAKALEEQHPTLRVDIRERAWIEDQKMGLFLSVAAGNRNEISDQPRLVEMVYTPSDGKYDKTVLLVGKGIIFDTGGVNLKTGGDPKTGIPYIHNMHGDMAGAAAVIGALKTIAELQVPGVRVVGLTPLTPNRIDARATLPYSIATARNGKTVEVDNTDAEGRLVLADAMHYGGEKYNPDLILDIATLTGGKVRGLGAQNAVALMGNKLKLTKQIETIEKELGRKTAALKLTDAHRKWVTAGGSGKADAYNSVSFADAKRYNLFGPGMEFNREDPKHVIQHSAQGGAFLREFLHNPKTPWVHFDMAGAEFEPVEHLGGKSYATGFGVKELYTVVKRFAEGQLKV